MGMKGPPEVSPLMLHPMLPQAARAPAGASHAGRAADSPASVGPFLSCRPGSFGPAQADAYRYLAEWGVRYVEIPLPAPEHTAAELASLAAHGLRCGSLQVAFDVDEPGMLQRIAESARRASQEFGCRYLFTSVHTGPQGTEQAYGLLRRAGDAVAPHGVTLLLETHPDLGTNGAVTAATMRAIGHPQVRANWDPANVFFYNENTDALAECAQAVPFIGGMHLKDCGGGYQRWDFGTLGQGVVPFPELLHLLLQNGFQGPCTMEIEGVAGEQLTPAQHVDRVRASVAYLRGLGYFPSQPSLV